MKTINVPFSVLMRNALHVKEGMQTVVEEQQAPQQRKPDTHRHTDTDTSYHTRHNRIIRACSSSFHYSDPFTHIYIHTHTITAAPQKQERRK